MEPSEQKANEENTWHTGGYPQCDLDAVNGRLSDVEVGVRAARDHAAKNLALKGKVTGWLILIRVSLVSLKQLKESTHSSLSLSLITGLDPRL